MKTLKFYATWCGPCKALSAVVESAKDKLPMPVEDIDIDEQFDLAKKYNVRSVPTIVVVDDSGNVSQTCCWLYETKNNSSNF